MTDPSALQSAVARACCADLYQSPFARLVLGDSLHPGGLALTHRLGKLMGIRPGDWVVDLASGPGTSAMAISRTFRCRAVGLEFGSGAVNEALASAARAAVTPRAYFLRGDAELPPFRPSSVDAVLCECSLSLFSDQPGAMRRIAEMLRPGGVLGFSDVTVGPNFPLAALPEVVGQLMCVTGALDVAGYARLVAGAGLSAEHREDASSSILSLLEDLGGKVALLEGLPGLVPGLAQESFPWLENVPAILQALRRAVQAGDLGYWVFVARKPAA